MKFKASNWSIFFLVTQLVLSAWAVAGTHVTFYHNDGMGSPVAATDSYGNLLWDEYYQAYGEPTESDAQSKAHPIAYTGHVYDRDVQLSCMGARYYDPVLGRFMGFDPAGFTESNLFSFNRYSYANNNPYSFVDPDGRSAVTKIVKFVAKGGDLTATFAGNIEDIATLSNPMASPAAKLMAAVNLASELAPVSLRDTQDAYRFLKGVDRGVTKGVLSKSDRLKLFNQALADAPMAKNADEALKLVNRTMDKIEDAYSGVVAKANPGLKYEGRMYGPRSDYTTRLSDGGLEAITKGNIIRMSPNGGIQFFLKNSDGSAGKMVFNKAGGG